MKKILIPVLLLLIVFGSLALIHSAGAQGSTWCEILDFRRTDYGAFSNTAVTFPLIEFYVSGEGMSNTDRHYFVPVDTNDFYFRNQFNVSASEIDIQVVAANAVHPNINLSLGFVIFGYERFIPRLNFTLDPATQVLNLAYFPGLADSDNLVHINVSANDQVYITQIVVRGYGVDPFPGGSVNGHSAVPCSEATATSTPTFTPSQTPTPSDTLTPTPSWSPTVSPTTTPSNTPTPGGPWYCIWNQSDIENPLLWNPDVGHGQASWSSFVRHNLSGGIAGHVTHVEFNYTWNGLNGSTGSGAAIFDWEHTTSLAAYIPLSTGDGHLIWDGDVTTNQILVGANTDDSGGSGAITLTHIEIGGYGNSFADCITPTATPTVTLTPSATVTPFPTTGPGTATRTPIIIASPTLTPTSAPTYTLPPLGTLPPPGPTRTNIPSPTPYSSPTPNPTATETETPPGGPEGPPLQCQGPVILGIDFCILQTIADFFNWLINTILGFLDWLFSLIRWLIATIGNIVTFLLNFLQGLFSLIQFLIGLINLILPIVSLVIQIVWTLLQLFLGWLMQVVQMAGQLISSFFNAVPVPIPGLWSCTSNPQLSDICAVYYLIQYTILGGALGNLIIRTIAFMIDMSTVFFVLVALLNAKDQIEEITKG